MFNVKNVKTSLRTVSAAKLHISSVEKAEALDF
jgi:hypothetical protein